MSIAKVVQEGKGFMIQLDPYEILHDIMSDEQRQLLIESLSCHDEIIKCVAEQLVEGFTDNGFAGSWCSDRSTAIQKARQKIAENADYAYKKTIHDMEMRIKSLEASDKYYRENWIPRPTYSDY